MATLWVKDKDTLPKRRESDHYPTAIVDVRRGLDFLWDTIALEDPLKQRPNSQWAPAVLDPGSGSGVWGTTLREDGYCSPRLVTGVEVREVVRPPAYDRWHVANFLTINTACFGESYDLVIGNPPYKNAHLWIEKSLACLKDGGYLLFLLRLTFLESRKRATGLFQEHPPLRIAACGRRPSFSGNGRTSPDAYMYCIWRKGFKGEPTLTWV